MSTHPSTVRAFEALYTAEAFTRLDEEPDAGFYARDRMVEHLDEVALATVERLIGALAIAPRPTILDLMASVDSHLPSALAPAEVVGLGLNERELAANDALTERVIHDLNRDPRLPFEDARFDLVVNTVSVDYLTRPLEVFAEVGRVLKPDGLFLVVFSNRLMLDPTTGALGPVPVPTLSAMRENILDGP